MAATLPAGVQCALENALAGVAPGGDVCAARSSFAAAFNALLRHLRASSGRTRQQNGDERSQIKLVEDVAWREYLRAERAVDRQAPLFRRAVAAIRSAREQRAAADRAVEAASCALPEPDSRPATPVDELEAGGPAEAAAGAAGALATALESAAWRAGTWEAAYRAHRRVKAGVSACVGRFSRAAEVRKPLLASIDWLLGRPAAAAGPPPPGEAAERLAGLAACTAGLRLAARACAGEVARLRLLCGVLADSKSSLARSSQTLVAAVDAALAGLKRPRPAA